MDVPETLPALVPKNPGCAIGPVLVSLTPEYEAYGRYCGDVRLEYNRSRGYKDRNERIGKRSSREVDQHGALAEVAVCRAYGLPLTLVRLNGDYNAPDLGDIDVKASWHRTGRLLQRPKGHPKAPPERPHVLACGDDRQWVIPGWVFNWQAQDERFACDQFLPTYPYAVPQRWLIDPAWLQIKV